MKKINKEVDIIEDNILNQYPKVLDILLCDKTTKKNIIWATDNYKKLWEKYCFDEPIKIKLITGVNKNIIMPRILKNKDIQNTRVKDMGEVYTPAWVCNDQINSIDNKWLDEKNYFNIRYIKNNGSVSWKTNKNKIEFLNDKTWLDYISNTILEISCWEAPYLTSRYDVTTGKYIPIKDRIWILDRKLCIINENTNNKKDWIKNAEIAYKSIYAYEYHGDSLLLAREALLYTYIENYFKKFKEKPKLLDIKKIARIISWNIWQMDWLKFTIPNNDEIFCIIKDWKEKDKISKRYWIKKKFIDLIQKNNVK